MPSKFRNVASVSGTWPAIGCVVTSWSWRYAHAFMPLLNATHEALKRVASSSVRYAM